jgi:2-methylcitrate dehydratase PrpD
LAELMLQLHTKITPLTQSYADLIAGSAALPVPDRVRELVLLGWTDVLGVALAGCREPAVQALLRWAQEQGAAPAARVMGHGLRLSAEQAALINATAAHALDYDDFAFSNHPSAVLVPAIVAAADAARTPVDGAALIRAYAVGYEIWSDAFLREKDLYYEQGWHPTAVLGTLGATASACVIWRLDATQSRHALALAASSAGGVFENFGTMAKPFHGGRAAWVGLQAAGMARCGLQASASAIEGQHGLLRAFSPKGRVDLEAPAPQPGRWRLAELGLNIKKYPVVGSAQRGIDAALAVQRELQGERPIALERISRIDAHISVRHAAVMPHHRPNDALQAKFSLQFALACALRHGAVGMAQLRDEVVRDPVIVRLMSLVQVHTTEAFEPGWRDAAPFDQIFVHLDDGRCLPSPQVRRASGHADTPLSAAQLHDKFMGCTEAAGLAKAQAQTLFDQLQNLADLKDAGQLRLHLERP